MLSVLGLGVGVAATVIVDGGVGASESRRSHSRFCHPAIGERRLGADKRSSNQPRQGVHAGHRMAIEGENDVAGRRLAAGRRAIGLHNRYHGAAGLRQTETLRDVGRHLLHLGTEPAAAWLAVTAELLDNGRHLLGRDGRSLCRPSRPKESRSLC